MPAYDHVPLRVLEENHIAPDLAVPANTLNLAVILEDLQQKGFASFTFLPLMRPKHLPIPLKVDDVDVYVSIGRFQTPKVETPQAVRVPRSDVLLYLLFTSLVKSERDRYVSTSHALTANVQHLLLLVLMGADAELNDQHSGNGLIRLREMRKFYEALPRGEGEHPD
ncbi:hypothetical protein JCM1840_007159 [Sporobolomyces johnsonii]